MSNKIIGKKYNRWTICSGFFKRNDIVSDKNYVKARCKCGVEKNVVYSNIIKNISKSCGCLQKEVAAKTGGLNKKKLGEQAFNTKYLSYTRAAKTRNYSWNLSKKQFKDIIIKPCTYCGSKLDNCEKSKNNNGDFYYTGIDRLDNSLGYTASNSVPCCKTCNMMKRSMSKSDFINHCKLIASREI